MGEKGGCWFIVMVSSLHTDLYIFGGGVLTR